MDVGSLGWGILEENEWDRHDASSDFHRFEFCIHSLLVGWLERERKEDKDRKRSDGW